MVRRTDSVHPRWMTTRNPKQPSSAGRKHLNLWVINRPRGLPDQEAHQIARPATEADLVIVNRPRVFPRGTRYQIAKRVIDVTLCLLFMPLILPLMFLCAIAIYLDSPGPAIFVQERIGKGERPFQMHKFRTMKQNLDDGLHRAFMKAFVSGQIDDGGDGKDQDVRHAFRKAFVDAALGEKRNRDNNRIYKPAQASQVTKVGRILRKTSLDELPQVINILKGEMSLVGPRPNVPYEVEAYSEWHRERLSVLPGITGLAQVKGRSMIDFDTIAKYDIQYARRIGLGLDVRILLHTVFSVLRREGVR